MIILARATYFYPMYVCLNTNVIRQLGLVISLMEMALGRVLTNQIPINRIPIREEEVAPAIAVTRATRAIQAIQAIRVQVAAAAAQPAALLHRQIPNIENFSNGY